MNWLAHIWLSPPDPRQRLGNLLADLLRPAELATLPPGYAAGVELHRRIDHVTDAHPATRRTAQRFWPTHRRAAGILTDVFFDHVLAARWASSRPCSWGSSMPASTPRFANICPRFRPPRIPCWSG